MLRYMDGRNELEQVTHLELNGLFTQGAFPVEVLKDSKFEKIWRNHATTDQSGPEVVLTIFNKHKKDLESHGKYFPFDEEVSHYCFNLCCRCRLMVLQFISLYQIINPKVTKKPTNQKGANPTGVGLGNINLLSRFVQCVSDFGGKSHIPQKKTN